MNTRFNEMIILAKDNKKKGGSLAAIFKLIEELLEFEDKIVECAEAQEMGENKERIEALKTETGKMYDTLFEMAQGGVESYRTRQVLDADDIVDTVDPEDDVEELDVDIIDLPKPSQVSKVTAPTSLRMPQAPKI